MPARICLFGMLLGLSVLVGCSAGREQARSHLHRGDSALALKNFDAALSEFQQAVRLDPNFADAHQKLGVAYKEAGDLNRAAESLEQATRLDPFSFTSIFELGEVYRMLDRVTQAIRAYTVACELSPRSFESRFRLASCYHQTGDLDRAIQEYKSAIKLEPRSAFAWSNLGAVYDARGEYYDAIRAYKLSLECKTQHPVVLVNLATAYLNQERWATARQTLQAAVRMDASLSIAHERLGYCFWREQNLDEAAQSYLRAMSLDNRNAAAFAGYGVVRMTQYLADPQNDAYLTEAVEAWHHSLEIQPDQPKLRALLEKYRPKRGRPSVEFENP